MTSILPHGGTLVQRTVQGGSNCCKTLRTYPFSY